MPAASWLRAVSQRELSLHLRADLAGPEERPQHVEASAQRRTERPPQPHDVLADARAERLDQRRNRAHAIAEAKLVEDAHPERVHHIG